MRLFFTLGLLSTVGFGSLQQELSQEILGGWKDYQDLVFQREGYQAPKPRKLECQAAKGAGNLRGACLVNVKDLKSKRELVVAMIVRTPGLEATVELVPVSKGSLESIAKSDTALETYLVDGGGEDVVEELIAKLKPKLELAAGVLDGKENLRCVQTKAQAASGVCLVDLLTKNQIRVTVSVTVSDFSGKTEVAVQRLLVGRTDIPKDTRALFDAVDSCGGNDSGSIWLYDRETFSPAAIVKELRADDIDRGCKNRDYSTSKEDGALRLKKAIAEIDQVKECIEYEVSKRQKEDLDRIIQAPANLGVFASEYAPGDADDSESCSYYRYAIYQGNGIAMEFRFDFTD